MTVEPLLNTLAHTCYDDSMVCHYFHLCFQPGMEARVTDEILNQIAQRGGRPAASQLAAPLLSELRR